MKDKHILIVEAGLAARTEALRVAGKIGTDVVIVTPEQAKKSLSDIVREDSYIKIEAPPMLNYRPLVITENKNYIDGSRKLPRRNNRY